MSGQDDQPGAVTTARSKGDSWPRWIKIVLVLVVLALACFIVSRAFADYSLADIERGISAIPPWRILLAITCSAGSYFCLTWFDWLALRYAGQPLAYRRAALVSFISLSIGHNLGFAALSSGAIRYRFYTTWGLDTEQVAKVIVFCGVTVGLGLAATGGAAMLLRPALAQKLTGFTPFLTGLVGWSCVATIAGYLLLSAVVRRRLHLWKWSFEMPSPRLAAGQVVAGTANYLVVSACLYQGMAAVSDVPFLTAAASLVIATSTALVTHVPGGLGVIEGVVLLLLPNAFIIGALVVFRLTYFLLPLLIGGGLLLLVESTGVITSEERDDAAEA